MVVIYLILASLGVAAFVMLTDTRRNDNFQRLEQEAKRRGEGAGEAASTGSDQDAGGGDSGGAGD